MDDVTQGFWPVAGGIAAAVGAVGGIGGVVALINSRSSRRKTYAEADSTEADAASKLTETALTLVQPLQAQVSELRGRVGQLESDQRTQHMLLVEHSVWDHLALARMNESGVALPPIPPLFPPKPNPAASVEVTVTHPEA